jgi:uncharacterized membrane protein (DUF373 family)
MDNFNSIHYPNNGVVLDHATAHHPHAKLRKYLEIVQDAIVLGLCALLFIIMMIKLAQLGRMMIWATDFSEVIGNIIFILVLMELFRVLVIYLAEHQVSVGTMVEVAIISTLREVILKGAVEIDWRQLLVITAFILGLGAVLRYAGMRRGWSRGGAQIAGPEGAFQRLPADCPNPRGNRLSAASQTRDSRR